MLDKVRNMLHYYNEFFQRPFLYDELDIVQMGFLMGFGQAPPGLVQLTGEAFLRQMELATFFEGVKPGFLDGFLAHELGHEWWPHITGMRNYEQDAWLSEGFTEYTSGLYLENSEGFQALSEEAENDWLIGPAGGYYGEGILKIKPHEQGSLYSPGVSYETQAYRKGPYVLHMLRQILGPELFRALLQRFLKDFAGKRPVTPDFIDTVRAVIGEYVTGETFKTYLESKTPITEWSPAHRDEFLRLRDFYKNLDAWFEDWYVDPGHAKIRFSWSAQKDAGGYVFTGRVRQDPEEFKMVLAPVLIRFKKDESYAQRFVDKPDYEFQLRLPREPVEVVFDEFKTLAAEVTVEAAQP
jgi:aminopeptidase N